MSERKPLRLYKPFEFEANRHLANVPIGALKMSCYLKPLCTTAALPLNGCASVIDPRNFLKTTVGMREGILT